MRTSRSGLEVRLPTVYPIPSWIAPLIADDAVCNKNTGLGVSLNSQGLVQPHKQQKLGFGFPSCSLITRKLGLERWLVACFDGEFILNIKDSFCHAIIFVVIFPIMFLKSNYSPKSPSFLETWWNTFNM